jgi:endonuclease/exonuclease/phosphatase family metal-dependent hydrolase
MKMIVGSLLIVVLCILVFLSWSSYPWSLEEKKNQGSIINVEPDHMVDVEETPSVIKVLTFNIGFLYGKGSEGSGYEHRDLDYYEKSLIKVSNDFIRWNADIVFLQEVDFESSRSHFIDQATFIAKKAGYPFVAQAVSWEANYIPFPYFPIKNNFGRMKSGGAILSKYPLDVHEFTLLKKPLSQPWWYNLFYLHRYFQKVTVTIGDKSFKLVNLHLEAFDKNNRREQLELLNSEMGKTKFDLIAGDFNMVPTGALKKSKFFNEDDYENDGSYDLMKRSSLLEVIPEEIYLKDEQRFFTFPSWSPDRRLDYIWYQPSLKMMKAEVLSSASSDHLPLMATFQINGPRFNPYSQ